MLVEFEGQKTTAEWLRDAPSHPHAKQGGKPGDFESY